MKVCRKIVFAAAALVAGLSAATAHAAIVNGSFESGLTGWTTSTWGTGSTGVETGVPGYSPTDGSQFASMYASAMLTQTFATTGGTLVGNVAFLSWDGGGLFNDVGQVKLHDLSDNNVQTLFYSDSNTVGGYGESTGWNSFFFDLAAGNYTLEVDVFNTGDEESNSQLLLDAVRISHEVSVDPGPAGVPEPSTWALMILGFGGMGATLRTRRRAAAGA